MRVLNASRSILRDVVISDSRIGALDLSGSTLTRVVLRGCRIDYVNLRGSTITDVAVEGCHLDDLDLGQAKVTRLAVVDTEVATLTVHGASFTHADASTARIRLLAGLGSISGLALSESQVLQLAPALARHLGAIVLPDESPGPPAS